MSRDDGFAIADVATDLLDDPKVRRLARATNDEGLTARCLVAYVAVVLASWRLGERVTLEDAAPLWLTGLDDVGERLRTFDLLDISNVIPEPTWDNWFGVAWDRREERRASGRKGGLAKARNRPSTATAEPQHSRSDALPVPSVPSVPTVPTVARAREEDPDEWAKLMGLSEATTGVAYALGSPTSKLAVVARQQVTDFGFERVESTWTTVVQRQTDGPRLTIGQIVLAADNLLRPIPRVDAKALAREEQAEREERAHRHRLDATQQRIKELRGEA